LATAAEVGGAIDAAGGGALLKAGMDYLFGEDQSGTDILAKVSDVAS